MGTKADLHVNDWVIQFYAGGDKLTMIVQGKDATDALDNFQEEVFGPSDDPNEWYDLKVSNGVVRVRTSFIGAMEAFR